MSPSDPRVILAVADLSDRTVIGVEDFARLVGISRSAAYEAARRGDFRCVELVDASSYRYQH
jgi:hypothetical protein